MAVIHRVHARELHGSLFQKATKKISSLASFVLSQSWTCARKVESWVRLSGQASTEGQNPGEEADGPGAGNGWRAAEQKDSWVCEVLEH